MKRKIKSIVKRKSIAGVPDRETIARIHEAVERRLTNARTGVLMAACAYIPTSGPAEYVSETTYQGFRSLEKAVLEYRAAVRQSERSRKTKTT
jgi:hypothetical protein